MWEYIICAGQTRSADSTLELELEILDSTLSLQFTQITYKVRLFSSYQLNAHFLYSITIYMLHYNPQHVSDCTLLIFRRTNCIITASGIVTLYKRPYSVPVESRQSPLSTAILYGRLQRVPIREAVIIQFVLLKISKVQSEICWGL